MNIIKYQFLNMRRYHILYIYLGAVYFVLPLLGTKGEIYISNSTEYIYRYNLQQIAIVYTMVLMTSLIINEDAIRIIKNYLQLYFNDTANYLHCTVGLLCITNIIAFLAGEAVSLIINYLYFATVPIELAAVHMLVALLEIICSVLLSVSLFLLLKKKVLVCAIYIVIITLLMILNNIYFALPLPMSLVQDYYEIHSLPLWEGRMILTGISIVIFCVSRKRFINEIEG